MAIIDRSRPILKWEVHYVCHTYTVSILYTCAIRIQYMRATCSSAVHSVAWRGLRRGQNWEHNLYHSSIQPTNTQPYIAASRVRNILMLISDMMKHIRTGAMRTRVQVFKKRLAWKRKHWRKERTMFNPIKKSDLSLKDLVHNWELMEV